MSFLNNTLQMNVEDYEKNRDEMVKRFNDGMDYLQDFENDLGLADKVEDDCLSFDFLSS